MSGVCGKNLPAGVSSGDAERIIVTLLDPATGLKFCPKCTESKTGDEFNSSKNNPDGLFNWCSKCSREDKARRRQADPEGARAAKRASYARIIKADPARLKKDQMVRHSRRSAARRNIPHAITVEDIYIPEYCPVKNCGRQLTYGTGAACHSSPSLDKYNPSLGYIPENIWVICNACNARKQDMSGEGHLTFGWELIESFKERSGTV